MELAVHELKQLQNYILVHDEAEMMMMMMMMLVETAWECGNVSVGRYH